MRRIVVVASALALTLASVPAFAEGEGDPFLYRAPGLTETGSAFFTDTGSSGYPVASGRHTQRSDMGQVRAQGGSEWALESLQEAGVGHPRG